MAEYVPSSSFVQCSGCGRRLSSDRATCPFCGTALAATGDQPEGKPAGEPAEESPPALAADSAQPVDWTRFALAGTVGLLVALLLGYAWYFIAVQEEKELGYAAIAVGLITGWAVAFVCEGNGAPAYRVLGGIMALAGIVLGQYLIFARPQTSFVYEFNALTALFYFFALIFGMRAPDFAARYGLLKFGLISQNNKRPLLAGTLLALVAMIVVGLVTGLLVSPGAVQAKIHLTRAVSRLEADDLNQAKIQLQLALEDYGAYADAHFLLGLLEGNDFALGAAGDHFNRALEIGLDDEQYAEAHFQLGLIGWYMDDFQPAMDHLNMAIDAGYEDGSAYLFRGALFLESGKPVAATADFNRALSLGLEPGDAEWARARLEEIEAGNQEATAPQEQPGFSEGDSLETSGYDRVELYQAMRQYLSVKDLQDVADTVGANYDDLGGSGLSGKARELIQWCERRDRIPDLLDALAQVRPDMDWHDAAGLR